LNPQQAFLPQTLLQKKFTPAQADEIIAGAGTPEYKQKLINITNKVVDEQGAFGCPWFWVTNEVGKGEPFFGSDRYVNFRCQFFHFLSD
jgi:glutathione S-transferase kappa 1